jgi:DNA processing protein
LSVPASKSTDDLISWLTLQHATGVGPASCRRLLERFATPSAVRDAGQDGLLACGLSRNAADFIRQPDMQVIGRDLDWLEQAGNHLLTLNDPDYPPLLAQIPDPPMVLYVHGKTDILGLPQLAIVGSRNPTAPGQRSATEFASHLAAAGLTITSGLALGIDTAAHRGALAIDGVTIAVMGTGLDRVYPAANKQLAHDIAENGALISEFPIGTAPRPENFPQRNRIISGLSLGTLVVEAAQRSGSLISARLSSEQGREVFAMPGSIHNPLARGCHALIRQGAKLVETAQDIIEELAPLAAACAGLQHSETAGEAPDLELAADPEYLELLEKMGFDTITIDQLIEATGLTAAVVSSMLLQLEMSDYIASSPGGIYNRLK